MSPELETVVVILVGVGIAFTTGVFESEADAAALVASLAPRYRERIVRLADNDGPI